MSEEKKDDTQEQQNFLSGHEELLNAIHKKADGETSEENAPESPEPRVEAVVAEETPDTLEIVEEPSKEPVAEPEEAVQKELEQVAAPVTEPEPVVEEPGAVTEETPAPAAAKAEEPEKETPAANEPAPAPKKKKAHHKTAKTIRTEEEKKRHEELLKNKAFEDKEVKEVLNFFQKYLKPVAIVIVVICGAFLVSNFVKNNKLKKNAAADALVTNKDYQAVLDDYSKTPSAPLALMGLAQEKFNSSQPAEAEKLYGEFVEQYPNHEMAVQAEFNQIACKEATGALGEAIILYGDFNKKYEKSHLAPVALLGKARCLELLDNDAEAKLIYEDIITFYPESGWSQTAETKLSVVESKLK